MKNICINNKKKINKKKYKKWMIIPMAMLMLLAPGCGAYDNSSEEAEESNEISERQDNDTREFDYQCFEVKDLDDLYDVVDESDDRFYECDYDEYASICEIFCEDCQYNDEDMKYIVVANEGKFIESAEPIRFYTDGDEETFLYIHELLDFEKDGQQYSEGAYVMIFPVSGETEDLSVCFCTSQEEIYNITDALNDENQLIYGF